MLHKLVKVWCGMWTLALTLAVLSMVTGNAADMSEWLASNCFGITSPMFKTIFYADAGGLAVLSVLE